MKYQIILEILFLLLARKKVKASDLAIEYGVSRRTIMRYIQTIELAGIPVYSEKGRYGGFFIAEGYKLQNAPFTGEEIGIISDLLNACKHEIGERRVKNLKNKLISLSDFSGDLISNQNRIIIVNENSQEKQCEKFATKLMDAISNCYQAVVCYTDNTNELKSKTIEPHALLLQNSSWHLLAYCPSTRQFTTLKMRDIAEVFLCEKTFKRKNYTA